MKELSVREIENISREVMQAVKAISLKYGVEVRDGGGRYSSVSFRKSIEFFVPASAEGIDLPLCVDQKIVNAYKSMSRVYGLNPEWLNKTFTANGEEFRVVGLDTKKPKNCVILIRTADNARRKCGVEFVKTYMK